MVAIMARYAVAENPYNQWHGMTLKKDYESALNDLAYSMFLYLTYAICMLEALESWDDTILRKLERDIAKADKACQTFSVVVDFVEANSAVNENSQSWDADEALEEGKDE
jgi:hypothetical protein